MCTRKICIKRNVTIDFMPQTGIHLCGYCYAQTALNEQTCILSYFGACFIHNVYIWCVCVMEQITMSARG